GAVSAKVVRPIRLKLAQPVDIHVRQLARRSTFDRSAGRLQSVHRVVDTQGPCQACRDPGIAITCEDEHERCGAAPLLNNPQWLAVAALFDGKLRFCFQSNRQSITSKTGVRTHTDTADCPITHKVGCVSSPEKHECKMARGIHAC